MALDYLIAWVTIAAQDFERSQNFYEQLLGKAPDRTLGPVDRPIYAEFQLNGLRFGIYRPQSENSAPVNTAPLSTQRSNPMSICFQVKNLEQAIAHLASIGFPVAGEILTPRHGREVYAADPDGNRLILYQPH